VSFTRPEIDDANNSTYSKEEDRIEADFLYTKILELTPNLKEQLQYYNEVSDIDTIHHLASFVSGLLPVSTIY